MSKLVKPLDLIGPDSSLTWTDQDSEPLTFTGQHLKAVSANLADALGRLAPRGSRVILAFPPGLAFVQAFFAVLAAGMVAVPVPLPRRRDGGEGFVGIIADCSASLIWTTPVNASRIEKVLGADSTGARIIQLQADDEAEPGAHASAGQSGVML